MFAEPVKVDAKRLPERAQPAVSTSVFNAVLDGGELRAGPDVEAAVRTDRTGREKPPWSV